MPEPHICSVDKFFVKVCPKYLYSIDFTYIVLLF
jgi:hypothetical protein